MKQLASFLILVTTTLIICEAADDRVKITVYYESLCPDSRRFINGQLSKAFLQVNQITNIELIPFGKANVRQFMI